MRIASLIVAAGIATAGIGVAGVAIADTPCPTNRVCIYGNNDWDWLMSARAPGYPTINVPAHLNDKMDSWRNGTARDAAWYHHIDGGGTCRTLRRVSSDDNINFTDSDKLSSWKTNGGCP